MFPIKFGEINIRDQGHASKEAEEPQDVWLYSLRHYEYDTDGIIGNHYIKISYVKIFIH